MHMHMPLPSLLQTFQAARATVKERHPSIPYKRQLLNMPDGGVVSLDWALPGSIDRETAEDAPLGLDAIQSGRKTALLIAGLTGGSYEHYMRCAKFYCNAYTEDLRFVANYLVDEYAFGQKEAFLGVGFSMGANVLTKYLGEQGTSSALTAGVSDYPGVDMEALRRSTLVYDFDELFTIKLFRYSTVDEFYADASSVTRLAQVRVPLLCLSAADDPIYVPAALPTREQVEANPHVILCVAKSGGHLGFFESARRPDEPMQVDKTQESKWSERVWSARVIAEFAESVARKT
ncbi:hypothetical protein BBJ28_00025309 [Nothophytophthora sp. Chile5]|nr:hypothetical protein BBJ28_00025309 [Nothophytophthora sp. Chile5]